MNGTMKMLFGKRYSRLFAALLAFVMLQCCFQTTALAVDKNGISWKQALQYELTGFTKNETYPFFDYIEVNDEYNEFTVYVNDYYARTEAEESVEVELFALSQEYREIEGLPSSGITIYYRPWVGKVISVETYSGGGEKPEVPKEETPSVSYVLNTNTMKFHNPNCQNVPEINMEHREYFTGSRSEVIERGFEPCGNCKP